MIRVLVYGVEQSKIYVANLIHHVHQTRPHIIIIFNTSKILVEHLTRELKNESYTANQFSNWNVNDGYYIFTHSESTQIIYKNFKEFSVSRIPLRGFIQLSVNYLSKTYDIVAASTDADVSTKRRQLNELGNYLSATSNPVIIGVDGKFQRWQEPPLLLHDSFRDCWREVGTSSNENTNTARDRYDRVWYNSHAECVTYRVLESKLDRYAIYTEFE